VTGGTGFIGSHLLPHLVDAGYELVVTVRSVSRLNKLPQSEKITLFNLESDSFPELFCDRDIIGTIHMATEYGKKDLNFHKMLGANLELPLEILKHGASSMRFFINTHTCVGTNYDLYAMTKAGFFEMSRYFADNYDLSMIHLRLEYVYGSKDDTSKFLPLVMSNMKHGLITPASLGEQRRDFVHIDDVVEAYLATLKHYGRIGPGLHEYHIGTGIATTLKEMVSVLEDISGTKSLVEWGKYQYKKNEVFHPDMDLEPARKDLDWKAKISLRQGLEKTWSEEV
jgi:nucleoside-diphosphate-sugar epimerase